MNWNASPCSFDIHTLSTDKQSSAQSWSNFPNLLQTDLDYDEASRTSNAIDEVSEDTIVRYQKLMQEVI